MGRPEFEIPHDNVTAAFSAWHAWEDRGKMPDGVSADVVAMYGGVYVLAHFSGKPPAGPADPLDDAVIYVGEGKHLGSRWKQFERSAFSGKWGHSGGHSYRAWLKRTKGMTSSLHVAALPSWFADEGDTDAYDSRARRFRMLLEQRILWALTIQRRGRSALTLLNRK